MYAGHNELQRTVDVPWQDWRVAPTVVMTPEPSVAMLPPTGDGKIYDDSAVWQMRMSGASPRRFALVSSLKRRWTPSRS